MLVSGFDKSRGTMMGGPGSGGWNRSMRTTLEEHRFLDVARLFRCGVLDEGGQARWCWADKGSIGHLLIVGSESDRRRGEV